MNSKIAKKVTKKATATTTTTSNNNEVTMSTHPRTVKTVKAATAPATEQTQSTPSPTALPLVFLQPPPADAKIPTPPTGTAAPNGGNYRAFVPKATELAALPAAVEDLRKFVNFGQVFALTGLPHAQVLQAFDVGNQWSTMREETAAWDAFSATQEGMAWGTIRALITRLRPQFATAVALDPSLAVTYPGLATLFSAKSAIAHKAVATKRLNKAAIAKGEAPVHGLVGKRRQKAANKKLLAAAKAATPPSVVTGPVVSPPSPGPGPTAAPTASPSVTNGAATNGAAHAP